MAGQLMQGQRRFDRKPDENATDRRLAAGMPITQASLQWELYLRSSSRTCEWPGPSDLQNCAQHFRAAWVLEVMRCLSVSVGNAIGHKGPNINM